MNIFLHHYFHETSTPYNVSYYGLLGSRRDLSFAKYNLIFPCRPDGFWGPPRMGGYNTMGTGGSFLGGKKAEELNGPFTVKKIHPLPNTSSWRSA
jgi:hypothetical protein